MVAIETESQMERQGGNLNPNPFNLNFASQIGKMNTEMILSLQISLLI